MLEITYNEFRNNIQIQNKKTKNTLQSIFNTKGIGTGIKNILISKLGVNKRIPYTFSLNRTHNNKIRKTLEIRLIGDPLVEHFNEHISFYKVMKNYRGFRHNYNYPVRGQRTHTNAKTRKKFRKKYTTFTNYNKE